MINMENLKENKHTAKVRVMARNKRTRFKTQSHHQAETQSHSPQETDGKVGLVNLRRVQ